MHCIHILSAGPPGSPPVLGLGHVLALRVEARVGVGGVAHHLQLAELVIVAVAAVHHPAAVPLLVSELPVVPGTETIMSSPAIRNRVASPDKCHERLRPGAGARCPGLI